MRKSDTHFHYAAWTLNYRDISSDEFTQLEAFFQSCEGRLRTFTFLDPTDNLFLFSEDVTTSAWGPDNGLSLTPLTGGQPPDGAAFEVGNSTQSDQLLTQTIESPPQFQYCFSVWLRALSSTSITLVHRGLTERRELRLSPAPTWRRYWMSTSLPAEAEVKTSQFGILFPPGSQVTLSGLQVEAQPNPSPYHPTTTTSGIHPTARFDQDVLSLTTSGPESFSTAIQVIAPLSS